MDGSLLNDLITSVDEAMRNARRNENDIASLRRNFVVADEVVQVALVNDEEFLIVVAMERNAIARLDFAEHQGNIRHAMLGTVE